MKPLPKKTRAPKHARTETAVGDGMAGMGNVGEQRPSARRRVNADDSGTQPLIAAAGPAEFSHAGTSSSAPRRRNQQTAEEIRAEFAQLPVDPKLASLFTRSNS